MPTTLAQFQAAGAKLAKGAKKGFSPVYIAGTDWYFAMSFVFDYGGGIAGQVSGKWKSLLSSPKSIAGLTAYKNFWTAVSKASKTGTENNPQPYNVYAQGQAASIIGPAWFSCCVGKTYTPVTGHFVVPSHTKGQVMPASWVAPTSPSPSVANKALAADWISAYTNTKFEKALQAIGNIPNSTALTQPVQDQREGGGPSWLGPTAKNWVNVENRNCSATSA